MNKYCVLKTYTIKEVIDKIDESHDRVALVVNNDNKIIGVISQGDIIRALSSGKNLYARVESIVRPGYIYIKNRDMEKAFRIFQQKKITLLPIINEKYELEDVITLDDIYEFMEGK